MEFVQIGNKIINLAEIIMVIENQPGESFKIVNRSGVVSTLTSEEADILIQYIYDKGYLKVLKE